MAVNTKTIESAEITFCMEKYGKVYRDDYGGGRESVRQLPWAFIRFNDDAEERKYIMPLPPQSMIMGSGVHMSALTDLTMTEVGTVPLHYKFGRAFIEWMPFRAFPLESGRANLSNGDPAGPVAVHFFGGI